MIGKTIWNAVDVYLLATSGNKKLEVHLGQNMGTSRGVLEKSTYGMVEGYESRTYENICWVVVAGRTCELNTERTVL